METNLKELAERIHKIHYQWWHDADGNRLERNRWELLCLTHSEGSECMEGERKNLMDDKLPSRKMAEVEIADLFIRVCDYLVGYDQTEGLEHMPMDYLHYMTYSNLGLSNGPDNKGEALFRIHQSISGLELRRTIRLCFAYANKHGYDLLGAMEEKLAFNQTRADHKIENRMKEGGKKF